MYKDNHSGIAFEKWKDNRSVGMHQHRYYEILIVERGSCKHIYRNADTLLIPGDVVIVMPDELHGLSISGDVVLYNCQFLPGVIDEKLLDFLKKTTLLRKGEEQGLKTDYFIPYTVAKEIDPVMKRPGVNWVSQPLGELHEAEFALLPEAEDLSYSADREAYYFTSPLTDSGYEVNSSRQGVIHLNPEELGYLTRMLEHILSEEEQDAEVYSYFEKKYTEVLLLELETIKNRQYSKYSVFSKKNLEIISDVLAFMEAHIAEELDFEALAEQYGFSTNYFRKIFRDVTGLSPVKYMNRLRIIRACYYLQEEGFSLKDAAAEVGILDFNYFSRLFKQIMGFSPSKL